VRNNYADRMCITRVNLRNAYKISGGNPDGKEHFFMPGHRQDGDVKIYRCGVKRLRVNFIRIGSSSGIL